MSVFVDVLEMIIYIKIRSGNQQFKNNETFKLIL